MAGALKIIGDWKHRATPDDGDYTTRKAGEDCGEAPYKQEKGQFAYQAGPVRVKSGRRCIWARADLGSAGGKPVFTRETSRKYRGRFCG